MTRKNELLTHEFSLEIHFHYDMHTHTQKLKTSPPFFLHKVQIPLDEFHGPSKAGFT